MAEYMEGGGTRHKTPGSNVSHLACHSVACVVDSRAEGNNNSAEIIRPGEDDADADADTDTDTDTDISPSPSMALSIKPWLAAYISDHDRQFGYNLSQECQQPRLCQIVRASGVRDRLTRSFIHFGPARTRLRR